MEYLALRVSSSGYAPEVKLSSMEKARGLNLLFPLGVRPHNQG